jgi:hypothetical protein
MLTGADAGIAANAPIGEELDFLPGPDAFRVVAPETPQRAAFQKDGGADAGPSWIEKR